jgi:hypothetical protein
MAKSHEDDLKLKKEGALLGVRAGAMDTGRDTLHLVFAVQLHFL